MVTSLKENTNQGQGDIQRITGRSDRYGRMLLCKIKTHFHKLNHQFVTIEEFCLYTGLKQEDVKRLL